MKTAFPTAATVHEGVEMMRRTGAKSVISIGNGAVSDVAKGIRALMESGAKTVAENDDKITSLQQSSTATTNEVSYPHIAVSTTLSPTPSLPGWVCLHHEEDVFTRRSCKEPQVRAIIEWWMLQDTPATLCSELSLLLPIFRFFSSLCALSLSLADFRW